MATKASSKVKTKVKTKVRAETKHYENTKVKVLTAAILDKFLKDERSVVLCDFDVIDNGVEKWLLKNFSVLSPAAVAQVEDLLRKLALNSEARAIEGSHYSVQSGDPALEYYEDDLPRPERSDPPGTITNCFGMKFVPIAAGTFMMGTPTNKNYRGADEVQHEVTLTQDFYLGMTQVTQSQYERVMGENCSHFQGGNVFGKDSSEFPVDSVFICNAEDFCSRLSVWPGETLAGRVYRLPTEAEWEYACRAGSKTTFCSGDKEESVLAHAWCDSNSAGRPHPVALKEPNRWGLYDMHGNVSEWCSDCYGDYPNWSVTDPVGSDDDWSRVLRGGSYNSGSDSCRSANRSRCNPSQVLRCFGFRVVMSLVGVPKGRSRISRQSGVGGRRHGGRR